MTVQAQSPAQSIGMRYEITSIKIEKETDTLIKVSVLAKLILDGDLGEHPYFIEEECYADCQGDFTVHAFNPTTIGHGPKVQLMRYSVYPGNIDEIGTMFEIDISKKVLNGALIWKIPFYVFDISQNSEGVDYEVKAILDLQKPRLKDVEYNEEGTGANFEELQKMYRLIQRIEVVQQFSLENGVFSIHKNGIPLLSLDLKQIPQIFPLACFTV